MIGIASPASDRESNVDPIEIPAFSTAKSKGPMKKEEMKRHLPAEQSFLSIKSTKRVRLTTNR
jgi:hypothetical protein